MTYEEAHETLSTYVRRYERQLVDLAIDVRLVIHDGSTFASGRGRLRDLSPEGAMISDIRLDREGLPLEPFKLQMSIVKGDMEGLEAEGTPVRFATTPEFGLGIQLSSLSVRVA